VRHKIEVDVNPDDVIGDAALHMTMMRRSGPEAVKLLLRTRRHRKIVPV
jgi:ankyrin repeat protein